MAIVILTESEVTEIKKSLWEGATQRHLANMFDITQPTISAILTGRTWDHIQWPDGSTGAMDNDRRVKLLRDRSK